MDMGDLRGLATVLCMIAFAAVVWWAYTPSRKDRFDEAAQLPFSDDDVDGVSAGAVQGEER